MTFVSPLPTKEWPILPTIGRGWMGLATDGIHRGSSPRGGRCCNHLSGNSAGTYQIEIRG